MELHILVVRDSACDAFGQPMFMAAIGQGVRSFVDEVNRAAEGNQLNKHPEDFVLYSLGTYDDSNAKFSLGEPRQLMRGVDALNKVSG